MRSFFASLHKDLKLLSRNWHTILSFMVLPFILIITVGFIFGSDAIGSIKVGLEGAEASSLPLGSRIDPIEVASCHDEFVRLDLAACIIQTDGGIEILVDNSRTNLYAYTVSLVQQGIERQNERLAITSITAFKEELSAQLDTLEETESQIVLVDRSIERANGSIDAMKRSFEKTYESLVQERISLQDTQAQLESQNTEFERRSALIEGQLETLSEDLRSFDEQLVIIRPQAPAEYRSEIDEMRLQIDQSLRLIQNLDATIITVSESQRIVLSQVVASSARLDSMLANFTYYSDQIDEQRALVSSFSDTSRELRTQLATVENGTRTALEFSPEEVLRSLNARFLLYYDDDARMLVLPMVVMMILVFLSIVIASLLTHQELTSPAMIRVELSASPRWILDLSKLIVITGIVIINITLMYAIAVFLWNAQFVMRIPVLLLISLPVIITFAQLGMALAYTIRRPFLLFVSATFSAVLFIIGSGILRPAELLDPARSAFITSNPSWLFLKAATGAIFGSGISNMTGILIWLVISAFILIGARTMWFRTVFRD
jgi:hypothetical protein